MPVSHYDNILESTKGTLRKSPCYEECRGMLRNLKGESDNDKIHAGIGVMADYLEDHGENVTWIRDMMAPSYWPNVIYLYTLQALYEV